MKLRGCAFNNNAEALRAANINRNHPENRNNNIGFRCVGDMERRIVSVAGAGKVKADSGVLFHFRTARLAPAA
jgi:hypothetical protein